MPEPTPIKKTFVRAAEPVKAPEPAPKPLQRPHSVSRELGSLSILLLGIAIGIGLTLATTTALLPMAAEIIARGVAIGAASR